MTIAGLYLSPEGIVLGADSTSSVPGPHGYHYFNHGQKIFEIGEGSTLGILTWGMGGLGPVSYRALVALLADELQRSPATSVADAAEKWISIFWPAFSAYPEVIAGMALHGKPPHDPADAASVVNRSVDEEQQYQAMRRDLGVGFCIAGYVLPGRNPHAVTIVFQVGELRPTPVPTRQHDVEWWGMQNVMNRLIYGVDDDGVAALMSTGKWSGTQQELVQALSARPMLPRAHLPIRDAIDYVHAGIYCTIKAMKFSNLPQVCGGPIELAVITADRKFRWVRHKSWDAAIIDGERP